MPGIFSEPFIRFFRHSWSTCEVSDAIEVTRHILVLLVKSVKCKSSQVLEVKMLCCILLQCFWVARFLK